jgi:hypothetical protein
VLTQQAVFNAAFHAGTTVAYREYSPGLMTSVALGLPLWAATTRSARRGGVLSRRALRGALAAGGLVHGAAVARQVYSVGQE